MLLEICVDSVESAIAAARGGADRLELCAALREGGITPSVGLYRAVRAHFEGPIMLMIRPRGADFLYSDAEFEAMKHDIDMAKELDVAGIVLGLLTADGEVDTRRTSELVARAKPLEVTFHRAFDMTHDAAKALETLIEIGIDRVLTSGQAKGVSEGMDRLAQLVQQAGDRIRVMPGAGIRVENFAEVIQTTRAKEYHASALGWQTSGMTYHNDAPSMGDPDRSEYRWPACDPEKVRHLKEILASNP
jgi:copper homeostasis protein